MDRDTSIVILVLAVITTMVAMLGDRARQRAPLARHALMPWHALLFVGLTATLFMGVHLLALA